MPRVAALDQQIFEDIRKDDLFYVDKTDFIREWWRSKDRVSLVLRPRRFGKTLMLSTVEQFLSLKYAGRGDLFEGLDVWKDEGMRALQGTLPVVFLSLASLKGADFATQRELLILQIVKVFSGFGYLRTSASLDDDDRQRLALVTVGMSDAVAVDALNLLCGLLCKVHGKRPVILLDEYDTPMIEAWTKGFWDEAAEFMRGLFNATFKTNPYLERALLTGITRVGRESMFSDLNNLRISGVTSPKYATSFGFTETEVFAAMDEYGLTDREGVKRMYDGFTFGAATDIYNPWSVVCYLQDPRLEPWWTNTSSNEMVGRLVREGSPDVKRQFMTLLEGGTIASAIDERIVFDELAECPEAIWSLLLAAGYLKVVPDAETEAGETDVRRLALTNGEVSLAMRHLVSKWFNRARSDYRGFLGALMDDDLGRMNRYMNDVSLACFSSFDSGTHPSRTQPERFYHGFVLGLLVDLRGRYVVTSNGESGMGRYDVMLEPVDPARDDAFIFEFKVQDELDGESSLKDTVANALAQIGEKGYDRRLLERGIPAERIRTYGFAFRGKEVLIGRG